ncbi:hypothetical protein GJQ55_02650 [Venatoribacter cucullus]|uniref:Pyrroloquinoline quinone biosynthesis protein PqqE n=1 Tax=Venatoribacter cucullus TaxID=2661630 RepID=A0A9X7V0M6_9GAMM|nr:hypothetical protein [Venatoribacter cucullus]QQD23449.1 hypothetical protein GJQ55_02650 [Venatoribacter cucullus]
MNIGSTAGSAFTSATYAIDQGTTQVRRAAQDVADATTERPTEAPGKLAESMTDLKRGELLVQAGGKVMDAADKQLGTLINTTA